MVVEPPKRMASAEPEPDLEPLRSANNKSGFLGVKVTSSGKYQPQIWAKELGGQRGIGSFDTPEEAALARTRANKDKPGWSAPVKKRAARDTVRCPAPCLRSACMLHSTHCLA